MILFLFLVLPLRCPVGGRPNVRAWKKRKEKNRVEEGVSATLMTAAEEGGGEEKWDKERKRKRETNRSGAMR